MTKRDETAVVLDDWPHPAAGATEPRALADDNTGLCVQYRPVDRRIAVRFLPRIFQIVVPHLERLQVCCSPVE